MNKIPLVIILGPTAVGKTELSIELAKDINGEIVTADSMQIYRYMDIGTAKPDHKSRQGIPHHLLDVVNPDEDFNVSMFKAMAEKTIESIHNRGKVPIIAGGTGLYINSLIFPMSFSKAGEDREYRNFLIQEALSKEENWLHEKLQQVDPITAARLHPNDKRRIIRALEIHHITKEPMSSFISEDNKEDSDYPATIIGLTMDRQLLYNRIESRVDKMLAQGLIEEVKSLLDKGYKRDLVSMQGLGYKELVDYLMGMRRLEEASFILKRNTKRFAKRQFTWFRRLSRVNWINVSDSRKDGNLVDQVREIIDRQNILH